MNPRIVFMGSPEYALPTLKKLVENFPVIGVVTQPDRPAGRGRVLTPPAVKDFAQKLGLPVIQPQRLKEPYAVDQLRAWKPDLIVVAAFGQILPADVLNLPKYGCLNVHASLLPRWRGAAPIQAAILHGDSQTGVTIVKMDIGLDTGPILSQRTTLILPDDTAGSLSKRLAYLGAELLIETLPDYLSGKIKLQTQDDSLATYAPMIKKADAELDFSLPATELVRRVRAFNPSPGAFTFWQEKILKIYRAHSVEVKRVTPAQTTIHNGLPAIGTGAGLLILEVVQPAGKKIMPADEFLRGAKDWVA